MKKVFLYIVSFLLSSIPAFAQVFVPDSTISGEITHNVVLSSSKTYLLQGFVYVDSTYSLTIPAGTKIFGDKDTKGSLIIRRGAKIYAQGTATNPIVFTSSQPAGLRVPGDWGGIIILGSASVNQGTNNLIEGGVDGRFGGNNDADNSGVFRYVRIEFPGYPFQPNNEINGLTCGGVGSGTTIDHVQVSYSLDDSFEFFGGTVNAKYLIAFKGLDDDFDTDWGFRGKVQFGFSYRDPYLADQSKSESFESDNDGNGSYLTPRTKPTFSNMTLIGPKHTSTSTNFNAVNHYYGVHQRRATLQSIYNSVFLGFDEGGILFDGSAVTTAATADSFKFKNNIVAGSVKAGTNVAGFNPFSYFDFHSNDSITEPAGVNLRNPYNPVAPDLTPNSGSPVLGKANFSDLSGDPFWTVVTYAGAFANNTDKWDAGWTNYDPQSTNYNSNVSWVSTIKVLNSYEEANFVVFGRGTGATNGIDASFGEALYPPAVPDLVDSRWILPSSPTDVTVLDIRNTGTVAGNRLVYKLQVNPGLGSSLKLSWDPNYLGAGAFYISDSLGGALFSFTNMKTTPNVTFNTSINTNYTVYIYVYTTFNTSAISIGNSWNMVSYPGLSTNMTPSAIWNQGQTGVVYSFSGSYQAAATITPGVGYWMKHNGARNYTFSNVNYVPVVATNSNIGWNLVGVYSYAAPVSGLTTIPSNARTGLVYGFTPGAGYSVASVMDPGRAYWVNVNQAGQIRLAGPYSGIAKIFTEDYINKEWGKIYLTDADGKHYTLYAANNNVDLNFYELPPAPPEGMFDVRFGSQRFVEDLSSTQTIDFSGVTYPVTIKVEGISVKIEDNLNGNLVKSELNSNQQLVIENSNVSSLKISSGDILPSKFELSQNYPNPFNPSTLIRFSIPVTSNVKLTIYNALGQQVTELVNQVLEVGSYNFNWDASNLSSGIYFYELNAGNFSSVKKMMLLK